MRYGLISDIHSNLVALDAVINYLKGEKVDAYICCGDIIGYGPWPNECVEIIKNLAGSSSMIIVGNHDWAALDLEDITKFNEEAQEAIIWTKGQLTKENQAYLKELPYILYNEQFTIVHGSPRDPVDEYVLGIEIFKHSLPYLKTNICFVGHTHVPFCFYQGIEIGTIVQQSGETQPETKKENLVHAGEQLVGDVTFTLDTSRKYMINIGSVGQPRDNDPRACCGIFDEAKKEVTIKRLPYDVKMTQAEMAKHNLPFFLIERLEAGV